MKEEFKRLMELFERHQQGDKIDLNELLRASTAFFSNLKEEFLSADDEEKKEIMVMVNQMYTVLLSQSKRISQMTGMGEEELNSFMQNPNNFTPEQWELMRETREKIFSSGKEITDYLKKSGAKPSLPKSEDLALKKKPRRSPRDKWTKS